MPDRPSPPPKDSARAAREKRLAEALRANLRRRKGAAREADGAGARGDGSPAEKAPKAARNDD